MRRQSALVRLQRPVSVLWTILVLLLAGAAGMSAASVAAAPIGNLTGGGVFAGFLLYVPLALVCITVHEAGHIAAAKSLGWRVHSISVGLLSYRFAERRFAGSKRGAAFVLSGLVSTSMPTGARNDRLAHARVLFGGAAANFALALLTAPFVRALRFNWDALSHVGAALGACCIISLSMGLANLVLFGGFDGMKSDGLRLLNLARPARAQPTGGRILKKPLRRRA